MTDKFLHRSEFRRALAEVQRAQMIVIIFLRKHKNAALSFVQTQSWSLTMALILYSPFWQSIHLRRYRNEIKKDDEFVNPFIDVTLYARHGSRDYQDAELHV